MTLYKAAASYFKDADGFKWCAQSGARLDLRAQSPVRGTTAYWRDRAGQPLARLVLSTVRPWPEAGRAAMHRFSHVCLLIGGHGRSLMRIRESKLFWIDEAGFKYRKSDMGCIDKEHSTRCINSATIKPLGRYTNGLIKANEGQDE